MIDSEDLSPSARLKLRSLPEASETPDGIAQASAFKQLGTSFDRGLDTALISGQLPNVLARVKARSLDVENGRNPLTEEEFNKKGFNRYGSAFKRNENETPSQTQLRFDLFLKRSRQQEITSSGGGTLQKVANFGAEFAGGLTGDLPIAVIPYAAVSARIGTAGKALQVGWKQASAQAAANQSTRAAAYEAALASGSKLRAAGLVVKDHFKEALIASTVETGIWGASEQYISGDVTMGDLAINGAFSLGMSTPFSAFGVKRAWKEQGMVLQHNENIDTVLGFLENGETAQAALKLADFYEPAKKIARENEEFSFLLQDVDDISQLSPEQLDAANRFQQMVTIEELKKSIGSHVLSVMASDLSSSKTPVEDLQRDAADQTNRIFNAIDNNTYLTLPEADWQAMVLSGWDPTASDLKLRNQYLDSIDYKNMEFRPVLSEENSQTANLVIGEYDGPELSVDMDSSLETIGSANPETGQIRINPERVKADWEAGMPHLTGQGDSPSSAQKKIVFKEIDIEKLKVALKDEKGYFRFIAAHEAAHVALKHKKINRKDWLSDEAVNQEIAANEYAAMRLGIDWASLTKTPQMEFVFTPETKKPAEVSYKAGVKSVNAAEAAGEGVSVLRKKGEQHYGNPFSHLASARDAAKTANLQETVDAYFAWLYGTDHTDFKQERRQWVLDQIDSGELDGKKLLYYSRQTPNHAEVLSDFIAKRRSLSDESSGGNPEPTSPSLNPLAPLVTAENFIDVKNRITDTFTDRSNDIPKPPQQSEFAFEAQNILETNLEESINLESDRAGFFANRTNQVLGNPDVMGIILSTPEGYNSANDKGAVARKDHVRTALEKSGLANYSDIAETIVDIASRREFQESLINKIFNESKIDLDVKGLSEDLKTSIRILLSESNDMSTAKARVLQSLNETFNSETLRAVHNGKIQNDFIAGATQFNSPKKRIEWIQSQLDGQQRAGFNPQSSANVKSKAQIVVDAKPINDVLEKHGLWDVFIGAGHGPYLEVLRKQTGGNADAIKIYGKDLRANVNAFAADLMVAMRTGDTPAKWKGSDAFEELVDVIKKVRDSQLVALNRFGSNVRVLDNFSGWSQRWSNATIKKIGFDQFRKDMLIGIDWDATSRAHGDVLVREEGKDIPFDREVYLKEWYYRVTELKETMEGGDVARSFEQSRMVHLKADAEAKLLAKYSGEGNLGKLLMDQIRYRSEMISSLGFFGSEPLTAIQNTLDAAQLRRGDNVGKFKYDTVLGTTKLLINELDNPVDASFASIFKSVRKVGNLAFLPLSGFSALMDIPLSVATLKYTGAEIGVNEFMPQFIAAMSRQFKGDKSGMTAYFRDVGAAYDVVNNANVRQITGDVSGEKGLLDIAMSFMFEANGMLRITAAGQEAFADWTSRSLGKEAAAGKFNDLRLESLRNFGFTDAEISILTKSASKEAPDGIARVMPQTVEDANVSNKLREYYLHYMKQAVLEPDAGAQAISRGNFKDGTVGGVVMRTGFQYSSFILGLSRVIFNRFANGYKGSQLNHVRATSHLVAFVGTSLATAWFVTATKDLAKGRAPINPMNMSSFDWQRIVSQSGLVGIGEMPLELLSGSAPVSPMAKVPFDLAAGVFGRDGKKTAKAVSPLVGGNLPIVGRPIKAMLSMAFVESAGSIAQAEFDYLQKF